MLSVLFLSICLAQSGPSEIPLPSEATLVAASGDFGRLLGSVPTGGRARRNCLWDRHGRLVVDFGRAAPGFVARALSGDGSVVVGDYGPGNGAVAIWTPEDGVRPAFDVGPKSTGLPGNLFVSGDGRCVAGDFTSAVGQRRAFYWSAGELRFLTSPRAGYSSAIAVQGMSSDGRVLLVRASRLQSSFVPGNYAAFLWSPSDGYSPLNPPSPTMNLDGRDRMVLSASGRVALAPYHEGKIRARVFTWHVWDSGRWAGIARVPGTTTALIPLSLSSSGRVLFGAHDYGEDDPFWAARDGKGGFGAPVSVGVGALVRGRIVAIGFDERSLLFERHRPDGNEWRFLKVR